LVALSFPFSVGPARNRSRVKGGPFGVMQEA